MNQHDAMLALTHAVGNNYKCTQQSGPCSDAICKAYEEVCRSPETEREYAGRLIGEAWERSRVYYLKDLVLREGCGNILEHTASGLITDCNYYLNPKPLTDSEKLKIARIALASAAADITYGRVGSAARIAEALDATK